jgi:hypothetical protein
MSNKCLDDRLLSTALKYKYKEIRNTDGNME